MDLHVDRDGDLVAKYDYDGPYEIQYKVSTAGELGMEGLPPEELLNLLADQYLVDLNEEDDYVEFEDARIIDVYGKQNYVIRSAYNDFHNNQVDVRGIDYITFATNLETVFLSRGVLDRFDDVFQQSFVNLQGTNCTAGGLTGEQQDMCREVTEMLKILTSVHLTSFANASKRQLARE